MTIGTVLVFLLRVIWNLYYPSAIMLRIICVRSYILVLLIPALWGCAIHYYDRQTQAEHVWGFGHMVLKAPLPFESQRVIVRGTDLAGIGIGSDETGQYMVLGWERLRRTAILAPDTVVRLEWSGGELLDWRIGSEPPEHWRLTTLEGGTKK